MLLFVGVCQNQMIHNIDYDLIYHLSNNTSNSISFNLAVVSHH